MKITHLTKDGRCVWLEKNVLTKLFPDMAHNARQPGKRKAFVILDWISNDKGRVGVDVPWLRGIGVPILNSIKDLPLGKDYDIVNTGYDSIVTEETELRNRGITIIDKPCPFVRKLRHIFEDADSGYQYVFLCEENHITIKNFAGIFPSDMILVQMDNFAERIEKLQKKKPLRLVPYVTFLPSHINEVFQFINKKYKRRRNDLLQTSCLWVKGRLSPIDEILSLDGKKIKSIDQALLICSPDSKNKSVESVEITLKSRGLGVTRITDFWEFLRYEKANKNSHVLLVKSPIPNKAEKPIIAYINHGMLSALLQVFSGNNYVRRYIILPSIRLKSVVTYYYIHFLAKLGFLRNLIIPAKKSQ
jgi:4-hydroxy-3-methylbut-2-enyl diphosphate reductase IspH